MRTLNCKTLVLVLFGLIGWATSCAVSDNKTHGGSRNEMPINKHYFFEMSKSEQESLVKNLENIKPGDSVSTVLKVLGPPTHDQQLIDKKGVFKARVLKYYVKQWEKGLV